MGKCPGFCVSRRNFMSGRQPAKPALKTSKGSLAAGRIGTPSQNLLSRLDGVQQSGRGWRAMCPACGGTSRKLSVCEGDQGVLLVTCFSCHDTPAVLGAVGL